MTWSALWFLWDLRLQYFQQIRTQVSSSKEGSPNGCLVRSLVWVTSGKRCSRQKQRNRKQFPGAALTCLHRTMSSHSHLLHSLHFSAAEAKKMQQTPYTAPICLQAGLLVQSMRLKYCGKFILQSLSYRDSITNQKHGGRSKVIETPFILAFHNLVSTDWPL